MPERNSRSLQITYPRMWLVMRISTIKATQGRMPAFNPSAAAERPLMAQLMSTQGPLAREVADVRLGLEVMSRRDPRDTWQVPAPLVGPPIVKDPAGTTIISGQSWAHSLNEPPGLSACSLAELKT